MRQSRWVKPRVGVLYHLFALTRAAVCAAKMLLANSQTPTPSCCWDWRVRTHDFLVCNAALKQRIADILRPKWSPLILCSHSQGKSYHMLLSLQISKALSPHSIVPTPDERRCLQEQNAFAGVANRVLARVAAVIFVAFKEAFKAFPNS
eukprot:1175969-Prorocentrum_minimum.AAC.1